MALRFMDATGVTYGNDIFRKYHNTANTIYESSGGRRGAPYYILFSGEAVRTLTHGTRWIQGVAWAWNNNNAGANLVLGNDNANIAQLFVNSDYTVQFNLNGTRFGPVSGVAISAPTEWHYYELDVTLANAGGFLAGTGTVRIDGHVACSGSGTTSLPVANLIDGSATANQVGMSCVGTGSFMDYYCLDGLTTDINGNVSTNTAFFGDVEVDALMPVTDVTTNMGTVGGDGTHAYSCVNETPADDDTSYVFTSNTGSGDAFNHEPISGFTGDILAAQYVVLARKDSEGLREFMSTVGGSGVSTLEFLGTANFLSEFYYYYVAPLDTDNGMAWSPSVYNAEVFGFKLIV